MLRTMQSTPTKSNEQEQLDQDPLEQELAYDDSFRAQPMQETLILSWFAPERPYKKRSRDYYTTMGVIVGLLCLILFFAGQLLPVAVVLAVAFVSYALTSVPPQESQFAITTYGIRWDERIYYWGQLGRFWFTTQLGNRVLNIEYAGQFVNRLKIMLGDEITEEDLSVILSEYLINEQPLPTFIEKAGKWLSDKVPLENLDKDSQ